MRNDEWSNRDWYIVRAVNDFSHVFSPKQTLTFVPAERDGVKGYTISHAGSDCRRGCFKDTFLHPEGSDVPMLSTIADGASPLPPDLTGDDAVLTDIANYVNENSGSVLRLVGGVELPIHARTPGEDRLEFYVYQINNAVSENRTLLFLQPKLNPDCAANGNGAVIGYS
jgi:hypothetical protein